MAEYSEFVSSLLWKGTLALISPVRSYYPYICFLQTIDEVKEDSVRDYLKLSVIFSLVCFQFYSSYFRHTRTSTSSEAIDNGAHSQDEYSSSEYIEEQSKIISQWQKDHSTKLGLTTEEVSRRRNAFGYNETVSKVTWRQWLQFIWQSTTTPQHLLLEMTILLSINRKQIFHALLCTFSLAVTIGTSFWQSWQAIDVQQSLLFNADGSQYTIRDGQDGRILIRELVPGDIIRLNQGEVTPADCRVVKVDDESDTLCVDQSAITGESTDVQKYTGGMCYQSTGVVDGNAWAVVTAIGWHTFIGRTMQMIVTGVPGQDPPKRKTKPQSQVSEYFEVIRSLGIGLGAEVLAFLVVSVLVFEMKQIGSLMMTVLFISIPFELGSVQTIRATGAAWLAREKVVVGQSESIGAVIDALAGVDILCASKTGTLTANQLQIHGPWCRAGSADDVVLAAYLAYPTEMDEADAIGEAVIRALEASSVAKEQAKQYTTIEMAPFDAESKTMRAKVRSPSGEEEAHALGAPKAILEMCIETSSEQTAREYRDMIADLAQRGYRSLGVARKLQSQQWELIGVLPMFDPPRRDSKPAIRVAQAMGIQIQMLTGDAVAIASDFAKMIGLSGKLASFAETPSSKDLNETVNATSAGYAEVFPEHAKKIVVTLQLSGYRVAITGDGVNDDPALRLANCGIAVEGATETAQSASDVVMLKAGLFSIVKGVQISRQIFRQTFCTVLFFTTQALHQLLVAVILYLTSEHVLDLRIIVACNMINMLLPLFVGYVDETGPIPAKPTRWSVVEVWNTVIYLFGVNSSSLALTIGFLYVGGELQAADAIRSQITLIHFVLSGRLVYYLLRTDGKPAGSRGLAIFTVIVPLAVTAFCCLGVFGGDRQLTIKEAGLIWAAALVPFSFTSLQHSHANAATRQDRWVPPLEEDDIKEGH